MRCCYLRSLWISLPALHLCRLHGCTLQIVFMHLSERQQQQLFYSEPQSSVFLERHFRALQSSYTWQTQCSGSMHVVSEKCLCCCYSGQVSLVLKEANAPSFFSHCRLYLDVYAHAISMLFEHLIKAFFRAVCGGSCVGWCIQFRCESYFYLGKRDDFLFVCWLVSRNTTFWMDDHENWLKDKQPRNMFSLE